MKLRRVKKKLIYHSAYIGHQAAPNANTHFNHNVFFCLYLSFFYIIFFLSMDFGDDYDVKKKVDDGCP